MAARKRNFAAKREHPYFYAKLRWWMRHRELSTFDMGEAMGLTGRNIAKYIRENRVPHFDIACKMAAVLDIPVEYLWHLTPPPGNQPWVSRRKKR